MSPGEIPDSDPCISELNSDLPEWIELGVSQKGYRGRLNIQRHSHSNAKPTKITHDLVEMPTASSKIRPPASQCPATELEDCPRTEDQDRSNPTITEVSRTLVKITTPVSEFQSPASRSGARKEYDHGQRRRRFNFKEWVEEDRKTHEYVYKKRFRNFHGALSDSEDEDYGELQGDKEGISEGTKEDSSSSDSESKTSELNFTRAIRRREIIDSDSSDSEPNEEDEAIPLFERMLKRPIPAVTPRSFSNHGESQHESETLESSLEASQGLDLYQTSDVGLWNLGEAEEDRGGVDIMAHARPKRTSKSQRALNVIHLADSVAPKALTRALKIAARTARIAKDANHPSKTRENCEIPFKRPAGGIFRNATNLSGSMGKLFVNQSEETMRSLRRMYSHAGQEHARLSPENSLQCRPEKSLTTIQPAMLKHLAANSRPWALRREPRAKRINKKRAPQTPAKRRRAESPNMFVRTSIIEMAQRDLRSPFISPPRHPNNPSRSSSKPVEMPIKATVRASVGGFHKSVLPDLAALSREPPHFLSGFSKATFLGSNVIELLQGPCLSNVQPMCFDKAILNTSVADSNKTSIVRDAALILQICEQNPLQQSAFDEIYDYFLLGVAHLIDESQILEDGYLRFVRDEWLRLARKLLKLSICQNWGFRSVSWYSLLTTEMVIVAVVLVHARLCLTNQTSSKSTKVSRLFAWTIFYHQSAIFRQLDQAQSLNCRDKCGVELVHFGFRVCGVSFLPQIFEKSHKSKASWHIIELLAVINRSWSDWELPRKLLAMDIQSGRNVRIAMDHIQRLLSSLGWHACPDLVADLFVFYTKQQSYADPRGESIWLPEFLLSSKFDGSNYPSQDFSMFLEILGITLRKSKDDPKTCLKLAGRVTPLSALSFPASKDVSLADLSSASHQYGILIVLTRMLDGAHRPSVSQFRDLVILRNAHWAIRIKAISAWGILVRLEDSDGLRECCLWMDEDIFSGSEFPDLLIQVALKSSSEVMPDLIEGVPWKRLLELGFRSSNARTRTLAWDLSECCGNSLSFSQLTEMFLSLEPRSELDIDRFSLFFGKGNATSVSELYKAQKLPLRVAKEIYTRLFKLGLIKTSAEIASFHFVLLECLLDRDMFQDKDLLAAGGIQVKGSIYSSRLALRPIVSQMKLNEGDWMHVLQHIDESSHSMSNVELSSFMAVAGEARRLAFSEYPDLINQFPPTNKQSAGETMQQNILSFVRKKEISCFYYLAYRLRQCCPTSSIFNPALDLDTDFISELLSSIYMKNKADSQHVSNVLMNYIFASFFDLACKIYSRTLKSQVSRALPTIIKCAIANMGRATSLQYGCRRLLHRLAVYLNCRMKLDAMIMEHNPTLVLVSLFCELSTTWLHQSHNSGRRDPKFVELIFLVANRVRVALKDSSISSIQFGDDLEIGDLSSTEEFADYAALDNVELLSAFACSEPDDDKDNQASKAKASLRIGDLILHCMLYDSWCRT